jgi:hypothetical protein
VGGIAGAFLTLLAQLWVGGTAAMLLAPMVGIGWGFYRTTTGIYLGLAVLTLWIRIWLMLNVLSTGAPWGQVFSSMAAPGTLALGVSGVLTLAFLVSLWGKHPVWSRRLLWAASLAGIAGLGLDAVALGRDGSILAPLVLLANSWLSTALLGLTFTGMLLGHWYLNEPGLPTRHVWRMAHWFLVAVLAQGFFPVAHGLIAVVAGEPARAQQLLRVIPDHPFMFGGRVLIGIVATLVIALVIRNTLRIPNVQSATGFFYIAILTVLLGEVLGRALFLYTGIPF